MTTFSVVGTGAVGGYYGARLAEAGHEVTFVFRNDADYIREHGFKVKSPEGDIDLKSPNCVANTPDLEPADVVIVAVKSTVNQDVAPLIGNALKPDGTLLLIQNGINGEPLFAKYLDDAQSIVGATALIAAERTERNVVEHFSLGSLNLGRYLANYATAPDDLTAQRLADVFNDAKVPTHVSQSLLEARWQKLLWNASFNPISVLANRNSFEMTEEPHCADLVKRVMNEVLAASRADGCDLTENDTELMFQSSVHMPPYQPSMKIDFLNDREMEVDAILGEPIKRAEANGTPTPDLKVIYDLIASINAKLKA